MAEAARAMSTSSLCRRGLLEPRYFTFTVNVEPKAAEALRALADLKGCQAHCSVILSPADEITYRKLGLQLTCEPQYQTNNKLYHK